MAGDQRTAGGGAISEAEYQAISKYQCQLSAMAKSNVMTMKTDGENNRRCLAEMAKENEEAGEIG
jgi:hypothetical protein